ncbi:MAG: intercellular adhesin biosynthesis polysaccharide N-deacetylase [Tetragenococcus koreensis]|uniref:Poly-beta-1,6-N-acetyl-D-glucosamine N-deacetylase n=1 Tax=Tetragenococcus halophilus TaxID=51669 RepID=A0AB37D5S1_TETHA|nr:intercellular adhesin biosynthesis polysaccharide N-deacetylase [Tetragenococcus halophilus]MDN6167255.1 intercellular adhesin biosynthesis polysaccharide N-deacetylase [Tetragenococcus koreensis]MDN6631225.1 intercellular adhesin biosynthesis polysaccharide N-deacetylase [Staphylococcus equorum]QGP76974.1 intercellular adhesin biosynthesis polysaccharide N-deacetylase [Tetragenococcus halophilus]
MKKQGRFYLTILLLLFNLLFFSNISVKAAEESTEESAKRLNYESNAVLALNYHRVRDINWLDRFLLFFSNPYELKRYSVSTEEFKRQMNWLVDHDAQFLTLDELIKYKEAGQFPERSVWINFDDMDHTIYDNAFPILKKMKIPATGFVITGQVGSSNFNDMKMINNKELTEMYQEGQWEFASHTNNLHYMDNKNRPVLEQKSYRFVFQDFKKSNQYLKKHWEIDNKAFAYPYGGGNDTIAKALEKSGIKYAFTLEERVITPDLNDQYLPRILVNKESFKQLIEPWKGFEENENN